ncbi:hypothetical protein [Paraflavitalea speifideaquila]|uniref:hypothetical protein n=1 Tax=Paraflavitalea speifideaquila TaxID=3076558 RepID=UPI0028E8F8E8|nr:hypothetical protein [Paraflavitalea speifideiaquila]
MYIPQVHATLAAPTGAFTDAWKPYAFFRHEAKRLSIALALNNNDPHFDIQVSYTKCGLFYVERYANNRLAGGANATFSPGERHCH